MGKRPIAFQYTPPIQNLAVFGAPPASMLPVAAANALAARPLRIVGSGSASAACVEAVTPSPRSPTGSALAARRLNGC